MLKKHIFFSLLLLFALAILGQKKEVEISINEEIFEKFRQLPTIQLYDTANYFFDKHSFDTAVICYNILITTLENNPDIEYKKIHIIAHNRMGIIFSNMNDFRNSYRYYTDALSLGEKYNITCYQSRIYNNIGIIYQHYKNFDIANDYYSKAIRLASDSIDLLVVYSNLGVLASKTEKNDSAFYWYYKSLEISKLNDNYSINLILNNIGFSYKLNKQYDSAYHYYNMSLQESRKSNNFSEESRTLLNLGELYFAKKNIDSALFYLDMSQKIAAKNNYSDIISLNYNALSEIAEYEGNIKLSFEYYKKYTKLQDSLYNTEILGDINNIQRFYEISKTNKQIEQLIVEQKIKENTIYYQKFILYIVLSVLLIVVGGLLLIYLQKRELQKTYKILVDKNVEIINMEDSHSETVTTKKDKKNISDTMQVKLLEKILNVMKDTAVICNPDFSLNELAELINTNHLYVSNVVNNVLKMNFRKFLNRYRIKEAQKLLSQPDAAKYSIELISTKVGFKSRNSFDNAFKEITGVSPSFYLKSINTKVNF